LKSTTWCIMWLPLWKMKVTFDIYGNNTMFSLLSISFQTSKGLWRFFFWSHHVYDLLVYFKWWKGDYKFETCQCKSYIRKFTIDNHMGKNLGKERYEREKACVGRGLWPWKPKTFMKTRFASKVIMFEDTFEFKEDIILYYGWWRTIFVHLRKNS
jgi:hypothetical protein